MAVMMSGIDVSAIRRVPWYWPSRTTVIRSEIANTSSSRCET
jgi:hypothetical protein